MKHLNGIFSESIKEKFIIYTKEREVQGTRATTKGFHKCQIIIISEEVFIVISEEVFIIIYEEVIIIVSEEVIIIISEEESGNPLLSQAQIVRRIGVI